MKKIPKLQPDLKSHQDRAFDYLKQQQYFDAILQFQQMIEKDPFLPEVHTNIALVYKQVDRLSDGIEHLKKAINISEQLGKQDDNMHNYLAEIQYKIGDFDNAIYHQNVAIDLNPSKASYHKNSSLYYKSQNNFEKALSAIQKAIELDPVNGEYHKIEGLTYKQMGQFDSALNSFQKALEQYQTEQNMELLAQNATEDMGYDINALKQAGFPLNQMASVLNDLGTTYIQLKNYDEAFSNFFLASNLKPDSYLYQNNVGLACKNMRNYPQAIQCFQKALELNTNDSLARAGYYFNIGISYMGTGEYEQAISNFKINLQLDNNGYTEFQIALAIQDLLILQGQDPSDQYAYDQIDHFQQALEQNPQNPIIYTNRGNVYYKMDRNWIKMDDFLKAKQLLDNPEAQGFLPENTSRISSLLSQLIDVCNLYNDMIQRNERMLKEAQQVEDLIKSYEVGFLEYKFKVQDISENRDSIFEKIQQVSQSINRQIFNVANEIELEKEIFDIIDENQHQMRLITSELQDVFFSFDSSFYSKKYSLEERQEIIKINGYFNREQAFDANLFYYTTVFFILYKTNFNAQVESEPEVPFYKQIEEDIAYYLINQKLQINMDKAYAEQKHITELFEKAFDYLKINRIKEKQQFLLDIQNQELFNFSNLDLVKFAHNSYMKYYYNSNFNYQNTQYEQIHEKFEYMGLYLTKDLTKEKDLIDGQINDKIYKSVCADLILFLIFHLLSTNNYDINQLVEEDMVQKFFNTYEIIEEQEIQIEVQEERQITQTQVEKPIERASIVEPPKNKKGCCGCFPKK